jgi:hypothetical protein
MVVNRLQNSLINSRIAPRASRLNCQNIFFQMGLHRYFFLVILIEILILKTTMYHKYNFILKKITLTFETNDEHQAKSYQNALRYNVITKLR